MNNEQKTELINIGIFLHKNVNNFGISKNKEIIISDLNNINIKQIIHRLINGQIFAEILNFLEPNCIDLRCLDFMNGTKECVIENMSAVINTIFGLDLLGNGINIALNPLNFENLYFDSNVTVSILLNVSQYCIHNCLNAEMNICKFSELIRLCQSDEEQRVCNVWSSKVWLKRWVLFLKYPKLKHNRKRKNSALKHSIDLKDHLSMSEMKNINVSNSGLGSVIEDQKMSTNDSEALSDYSAFSNNSDYLSDIAMVCKTLNIEIEHSENEYKNSAFMQEMILINVFKIKSNIDRLSEKEKQNIKFNKNKNNSENKALICWVNYMNALNDYKWANIHNLESDISNGFVILHLLNLCKDGCVDWNKIKLKTRNKFDKICNAKEILGICKKDFKFKLIGMTENSIVNGNKKYIKSLLTQMKIYFIKEKILKCLGDESGNDFDEIIIKYTNQMFQQFAERNKNNKNVILYENGNGIQSLNDKPLANCVYFLNLLSFVNENCINYAFVNNENEKMYKNAIYLSSVIRKLGKNSFASTEQICACNYDTIVSLIYCIVDIAHT